MSEKNLSAVTVRRLLKVKEFVLAERERLGLHRADFKGHQAKGISALLCTPARVLKRAKRPQYEAVPIALGADLASKAKAQTGGRIYVALSNGQIVRTAPTIPANTGLRRQLRSRTLDISEVIARNLPKFA